MLMHEETTDLIIGAAIDVHRTLGPGLLESAYEGCLAHELVKRGAGVLRQLELPLIYDGVTIDCGYRIDLLVNDAVIVEVKSVEKFAPIHQAQLMTYLKLTSKRVGLLLNFNVQSITNDGLVRRIL